MKNYLLSIVLVLSIVVSAVLFGNFVSGYAEADTLPVAVVETRVDKITTFIHKNMKTLPRKQIYDIVKEAERITADSQFPHLEDVLAIVWVESHFRPEVENRGSIGLMQVELKSHPEKVLGRDLRNMYINLTVGRAVLVEYSNWLKSTEDRTAIYTSYNAGVGNYRRGNYKLDYYHKVEAVRVKLLQI